MLPVCSLKTSVHVLITFHCRDCINIIHVDVFHVYLKFVSFVLWFFSKSFTKPFLLLQKGSCFIFQVKISEGNVCSSLLFISFIYQTVICALYAWLQILKSQLLSHSDSLSETDSLVSILFVQSLQQSIGVFVIEARLTKHHKISEEIFCVKNVHQNIGYLNGQRLDFCTVHISHVDWLMRKMLLPRSWWLQVIVSGSSENVLLSQFGSGWKVSFLD